MIRNRDRSGWIGASDTHFVMGNWETKTFAKWWLTKLGVITSQYRSREMNAGTMYEHAILDFIGAEKRDRQIKARGLRLRVNLDGEDKHTIHEVKTHKGEPKVSKNYWQQAQVEMFATGKSLEVVFYRLTEEEYSNFFLPIDGDRITRVPVEYDLEWVRTEYLPRLKYLAWCLKKKKNPSREEFERRFSA